MKNNKTLYSILAWIPYIVVFLGSLAHPTDSDLGWHLKYGEYFFQHYSILRENIFSSEMAGYSYINHSWGSDIIMYLAYRGVGFLGLSLLGAVVVTLTFYFFARASNFSLIKEAIVFPMLFYALYQEIEYSFRSQMISLLGIGILYYILFRFSERHVKTIWWTVPLFLVWANLHGGFILGLGLFGLWVLICGAQELWRYRTITRNNIVLVCAWIAATIATFINPFGWRVYKEIAQHVNNPLARYVNEWKPVSLYPFFWWIWLAIGIFVFVGLVVLWRQQKLEERIRWIIPVLLLWIMAYSSRRYLWPMLLISLPIISFIPIEFRRLSRLVTTGMGAFMLGVSYIYIGFFLLPHQNVFAMDWGLYCRYNACSPQSAEFLMQHHPSGRMMTDYNWGGWLIWNYPAVQPSMDGRMSFWRDANGNSAFEEYAHLEAGIKDIDQSNFDAVYISPSKKILFNRLDQLVKEKKWHVVYHDQWADVFVRK